MAYPFQAPTSPPPSFIPPRPTYIPSQPSTYLIDCVYQHTYVWLVNGVQFWYYPISVESHGVTGYRWNGSLWVFYGIDPRFIDSVVCYPTPTLY